MKKDKLIYIFLVHSVSIIGGMELYVAGKANYLENLGWEVFIFSPEPPNAATKIPSMRKYLQVGGGCSFLMNPPYRFKRFEQEFYLNLIENRLGIKIFDDCEIIIEVPSGAMPYWGELLAAKLGARYFFVALDEVYPRNLGLYCVQDNLDFFYFKWKRNELIGSDQTLKKLFNGYKNVTSQLYDMPHTIREQDAIQDVDFPIEKIERLDWNICHIGRMIKDYVPHVIIGVAELALRHPDKTINFILVGNADIRANFIRDAFNGISNVRITYLDDLVPIPRILFSKVDVVCAISQSAIFAANEGVLTVVATADVPEKTPGLYGYDTNQSLDGEPTFTYAEALENVLVKRLYEEKKYSLPKLEPAEKSYDKFWSIVEKASPVKEYYVERLSQERLRDWVAAFPFGSIARGARIVICGATEIAKDYRKQIESQGNYPLEFGRDYIKSIKPAPYCEVVAIVDEHPEEFDDMVVGLDQLKNLEYDAIVLALDPSNVNSVFKKIKKIIPHRANLVVYNFQRIIL